MKPITLKPHEITPLLEGKEVEVRRVVKPEPGTNLKHGVLFQSEGTYSKQEAPGLWSIRNDNTFFRKTDYCKCAVEYWREWCPIGTVGEIRWVREVWGVGTRPSMINDYRDGIEYKADEKYLQADRDDLMLYSVSVDIDLSDYPFEKWLSPVTMPRWASRFNVKILSVKVEKRDKWEWVVRVKRNEDE